MSKIESNNESNVIVDKISRILSLDNKTTKVEFEKKWNSKAIKDILKISENKNNLELAAYIIWEVDSNLFNEFDTTDKKIALIWVKSSFNNYKYLNDDLKSDLDIARQILKSYLREWIDFFTVNDFILNNYNEKDSKLLLKTYQEYLTKYSNLVWDDLSKTLLLLQNDNPELIKELKQNKVIINKLNKHIINTDFLKSLYYIVSKYKWYEELSLVEKTNIKKTELIKILWLKELSETIEYLLNLIVDLSFLDEDKVNSDNKYKKDNIEEKNEDDNDNKDVWNDKKNIEENDFFDDRMDYELPNYNYSYSWWFCNISTSENINIKISNTEKEQFTSEALENFINFYKLLYKLWLNFLWDKYNSDFKSLLAFKAIDFDYTSWKWITDSTTLKILNLIWKNIWVPEHEVLVNDGEPKTEIRCFKTLGDAKIEFESINASSIINDEFIDTNISIWAVEKKLSMDKKINFAKGEINISKW